MSDISNKENYWYIIKQFGIPRLALNKELYYKQHGFKLLSVFSLKGKLWKLYLRLFYALKLHKITSSFISSEDLPFKNFNLNLYKTVLDNKLNTKYKIITFYFPRNATRGKFSTLLHANNSFIYTKCGYDESALKELEKELSTYQHLKKYKFNNIFIPQLIDSYTSDDIRINFFENIPLNAKTSNKWTVYHSYAWKELVVVLRTKKMVKEFEWYKDIDNELLKKVHQMFNPEREIEVSFCHGDYTPWNTKIIDRKIVLFDFEESQFNVPILTDPVHFFLAQEFFIYKKQTKGIIKRLVSFIKTIYTADLVNGILLALLFEYKNYNVIDKESLKTVILKYLKYYEKH